MPLRHSQAMDGLDHFFAHDARHKRKLNGFEDCGFADNDQNTAGTMGDPHLFSAKRTCLWPNKELNCRQPGTLENQASHLSESPLVLPTSLPDTLISSPSRTAGLSNGQVAMHMDQDMVMQEDGMAINEEGESFGIPQQCTNNNTIIASGQHASMESDHSQHCQVQSPKAFLEKDPSYCGFVSCRGQKPSPASGRLHCHCSASWRGMYGIDSFYYSDYY